MKKDETPKQKHEDLEQEINDSQEELSQEELDAQDDAIGDDNDIESDDDAPASEEQKLRDQLLRTHAQMDNLKRRCDQNVEQAHKFAVEKLLKELLPILDSLEHALKASEESTSSQENFKAMHDGLVLTHKMFVDTLKKFAVEPIDPVNEVFDPNLHEAMTMVPSPDKKPNTVIDVIQKGYSLHGRVVRPARVIVAKAP